MVSVQRSIEIRVPVHTLYSQLTQFEDYPEFMHDIEAVEQRDDTHLHWKAKMMDQMVEWDAAITECEPDRCIAWQSENGPRNTAKVELQPVGPAASRLTLTMVTDMEFEPSTPAGDIKAELSERIWEDLARLRSLVEMREQDSHGRSAMADSGRQGKEFAGQESGPVAETGIAQGMGQAGNSAGRIGVDEVAALGSIEGTAQGDLTSSDRETQSQRSIESMQRDRGSPGNPIPASGFAAGSEGFSGDEDPGSPVTSASHLSEQSSDTRSASMSGTNMKVTEVNRPQQGASTQSDYSLSQGAEDKEEDGRYSVAEEVNFDQQSDSARHVGQLLTEDENEMNSGLPNENVIAKAAQRKPPEPEV